MLIFSDLENLCYVCKRKLTVKVSDSSQIIIEKLTSETKDRELEDSVGEGAIEGGKDLSV